MSRQATSASGVWTFAAWVELAPRKFLPLPSQVVERGIDGFVTTARQSIVDHFDQPALPELVFEPAARLGQPARHLDECFSVGRVPRTGARAIAAHGWILQSGNANYLTG